MEKTKIEFLLKNGFTLEEVMKIDAGSEQPEVKPEEKPADKPEDKPKEANPFESALADIKKEIAELREQRHADNRLKTAIEPETNKQLSFTEDIEKMIEEVTK